MAQTLLSLKKQPWLVSGTTAHTVKSTWPPAMSSSPQLLSTIRKPFGHEPELLVDLAAPEIVDDLHELASNSFCSNSVRSKQE
jgi:hypothetical protein